MERALVIGATGSIGRQLIRALHDSDIEVEALRRWNTDPTPIERLGVRTVVADLLDRASLVEIMAGYNFVFMTAAPRVDVEQWQYLRDSALGARNLLKVARQADVERVVWTSCATTIAPATQGALATARDVYLPGSAKDHFVEAQYAAELECFREAADGLDVNILLPSICVGDGAPFPTREAIADVSDDARINLVDVYDVARVQLAAARHSSFGERFAIGGQNTTIGEVYKRLEPGAGGTARLGRYDVRLVEDVRKIRHFELFRRGTWLDSSRAEALFGFRPRSV